MKRFAIKNYFETYKPTLSNEIGKIYVQLDDYSFPDDEWTDFGQTIVFWWLESFYKLLSNEEKKVKCQFMDGNYRFDIEAISSEVWQISFVKEGSKNVVLNKGEVFAKQATEVLLEVAEGIQNKLKKKNELNSVANYENRRKAVVSALKNLLKPN